jgi:enterochelin esterase-like enzyme
MIHKPVISFICFLLTFADALAYEALSPNQLIDSEYLGYKVQYRVYVPEELQHGIKAPTLYLTDGQWYIEYGRMVEVLDREIDRGTIEPVVVVFVDSRDPDDLSNNRRNDEFFGKESYVAFYKYELVPLITAKFPVSSERTKRVIGGISFGGLNAAVFGLLASETFYGIAMQSPANQYHLKAISKMYKEQPVLPVKLFFSVGTKKDNTSAARRFRRVLENKGYDMNYIEVPFGHTWENWRPLQSDLLRTFFSKTDPPPY